jgi:nucleotide-binding universal stress UspA family protein
MFKAIVWSTDGSDHAERALPYVKDLAREAGAAVTIVHVVERVEAAGAVGGSRRADEAEIQRRLEELTAELSQEGLRASLIIRGDVGARPAHEVVAVARDADADLIVVGSRGLSSISGLLLGSVAQRLLHIAPCPVLVVPPERDQRRQRPAFAR